MSPAEQSLLQRWADQRDAEAFAELVRRYAGLVFGTCRRILRNEHEAEDVAQDCFLKLAQTRRASIESLGGWLHRVATREALNRVKADQRRAARETAYAADHAKPAEILWDDLQIWVDEALDRLPEDLREPLIRHFLQGETHDEIARTLEVSRSTITRRIAQGIDQVRTNLRKHGVEVAVTVLSTSMAAHMAEAAPASLRASLGRFALSGAGQVQPSVSAVRLTWQWLCTPATLPIALAVAVAVALLAGTFWMLQDDGAPAGMASSGIPAPADGREKPAEPTGDTTPSVEGAAAAALEPLALEVDPLEAAGDTETVTLRCVDPGGNPVARAEVYFVHVESIAGAMTPLYVTRKSSGPLITDADGCVQVSGVPRCTHRTNTRGAYARVPGAFAGIWNATRPARAPAGHEPSHTAELPSPNENVRSNGAESIADIVLAPAADVRGRVTVPQGVDPSSVSVTLVALEQYGAAGGYMFVADPTLDSGTWPDIFEVAPDASGKFVFPDMPQDVAVSLSANAPGLSNAQYAGNFKEENSLVMEPEGILEGELRWERSGDAVPGVPVLIQEAGPTLPCIRWTDADGRYRLTGLRTGPYTVRLLIGDPPPEYNARPMLVDAIVGQVTNAPVMILERGARVSGACRDAQKGTPVEGAGVVALYPPDIHGTPVASATTGAEGEYVMRLPTGEFMLRLSAADGYEVSEDEDSRKVVVSAMQQAVVGLDFMLMPRAEPMADQWATVQGLVLDELGQPAEGVTVLVSEDVSELGSIISGADGRFNVRVRAGKTVEIRVGGGAFTIDRSQLFIADANQTYGFDSFVVKRLAGVFTGIVMDDDGSPLANAELYATSQYADWMSEFVSTGTDGRFTIDTAPEDDVMNLHIRKPGYGKGNYQDFRDVPSEEDRVYTLKKEE